MITKMEFFFIVNISGGNIFETFDLSQLKAVSAHDADVTCLDEPNILLSYRLPFAHC